MKEIEYLCKRCGKLKENHRRPRTHYLLVDGTSYFKVSDTYAPPSDTDPYFCEEHTSGVFEPEDNFDVIKRIKKERGVNNDA